MISRSIFFIVISLYHRNPCYCRDIINCSYCNLIVLKSMLLKCSDMICPQLFNWFYIKRYVIFISFSYLGSTDSVGYNLPSFQFCIAIAICEESKFSLLLICIWFFVNFVPIGNSPVCLVDTFTNEQLETILIYIWITYFLIAY